MSRYAAEERFCLTPLAGLRRGEQLSWYDGPGQETRPQAQAGQSAPSDEQQLRRRARPGEKPREGDLDTGAKCCSMLVRGLCYQGERGFALLKERWRALQHVTVSPTQIGDIMKAALVLTQIEHKMIA
jgi:hypothetical protein